MAWTITGELVKRTLSTALLRGLARLGAAQALHRIADHCDRVSASAWRIYRARQQALRREWTALKRTWRSSRNGSDDRRAG